MLMNQPADSKLCENLQLALASIENGRTKNLQYQRNLREKIKFSEKCNIINYFR